MNYLTKAQHSQDKARLTRLENRFRKADQALGPGYHVIYDADDPRIPMLRDIVAEVTATFDAWDAGGYAWPDNWHRWNIARDDAIGRLRWFLLPESGGW